MLVVDLDHLGAPAESWLVLFRVPSPGSALPRTGEITGVTPADRTLRNVRCARRCPAGWDTLNRVKSLAVIVALVVGLMAVGSAAARIPPLYKNCTNLNKRYPHGLGRLGARDKTSGTPVTTFRRSTRLYRLAMSYNRGLDRDKDGIACEQA
jgi:Excalibur calcium-binding domain